MPELSVSSSASCFILHIVLKAQITTSELVVILSLDSRLFVSYI